MKRCRDFTAISVMYSMRLCGVKEAKDLSWGGESDEKTRIECDGCCGFEGLIEDPWS